MVTRGRGWTSSSAGGRLNKRAAKLDSTYTSPTAKIVTLSAKEVSLGKKIRQCVHLESELGTAQAKVGRREWAM